MKPEPKPYMTLEKLEYHAQLLSNRIEKRYKHLAKRFRRENIDCFRLYDWDIPEIRAVVDWYAGHVVVGEYERTQTGPLWLPRMAEAVSTILNVPKDKTFIKRRHTATKEGPRYKKMDSTGKRFMVHERDLKLWVNLSDYLDTGLFSDHRDTRVIIKDMVKGKDFLNLFSYTCAFTCIAAMGGAKSTTSVDRSQEYLDWGKDNLKLNGLENGKHDFVKSDVGRFLIKADREVKRFDLAFVDPPSFYREETKNVSFDIIEGHPLLIRRVLSVMRTGGTVFFSTNHQRFVPHLDGLPVKDLVEITPKTIPEDYRNRQIHRCFRMTV